MGRAPGSREKHRERQRERGRCIFCKRKALGSLCRKCLDVNNAWKRHRAALFLQMRDFILALAEEGHAGARAFAVRLPRKATREYKRGPEPV